MDSLKKASKGEEGGSDMCSGNSGSSSLLGVHRSHM